MPRTLEMVFDAKVRNASDVDKLEATISRLAQGTSMNTGNLRLFNQVLSETAQRTGSYTAAVRELASQQNLFQAFAKSLQGVLRDQQRAEDEASRAAAKAANDFERAKAREAAAAKKAADEIIRQQERVRSTLGRVGARIGGQALGSAVGVPGLGYASGSVLGGLGLSGGTAMAIGGVATGIFAGVEFARSMDALAKWAQAQKNAAAETGISVSQMQQLTRISDRTGVSLTGAAKSVQDLSKEMEAGGGRAREIQSALRELGLSTSTAFESPYKGLVDIQKGLEGIKDPVERDRVAIELLGESAGRAAAATAGISATRNIISDQAIDQLVHAREEMSEIGEQWDVLKSNFATPLLLTLKVVNGAFSLPGIFDQGTSPSSQNTRGGPGRFPGVVPDISDLMPFASPAQLAAQRNAHVQSYLTAHGTPEDQYRSTVDQIDADEKTLRDRYQRGDIVGGQFDFGMAALESRRAAAEAQRQSADRYRSEVESFQRDVTAPVDSADVFRQLNELPRRYGSLVGYGPYEDWMSQLRSHAPGAFQQFGRDMLDRQYPGVTTGDYAKLYSPMTRENEEYQRGLERQERQAQQEQEQARRDQRQRLDDITARTRDDTERNEASLRLRSAIESGARGTLSRSGSLTPAGIARLDLEDQLHLIQQTYAARVVPIQGAITGQTSELGKAVTDDDKQAIQRQIDNERAELQKLQNDRLTQSVDALNKFNESIDEASDKLKDEFGNFAEGLFSAGLKGHAGSYSRQFLLGQAGKAVGNFAENLYVPGMLSIPGQGTGTDQTILGKVLKGTLFEQDPKNTATSANTTATDANTVATLALIAALGGDPNSLGLSAGGSGVSIPSIGGAGGGSSSLLSQVSAIAKGLGISIPGVTAGSSGGPSSIAGSIGQVLRVFGIGGYSTGNLSTGAGVFGPTDSFGIPIIPGVTGNSDIDDLSDLPLSMSTSGPIQSTIGSIYGSTSTTPSTIGGLTSQQSSTLGSAFSPKVSGDIGMGMQAAGGAFGVYSGVSQMTHGGAQNVAGGLGKSLMGASAILSMIPGADVAAPFVALAGGVSDLISAFMGDPRANRQKQLTEEEIANTYTAPNPLNVTTNANGMMTTTDYRGQVQSLDALPSVSSVNAILGFNPYNTSQLISSQQWQLTPSGMVPPSQGASAAGPVINYSPQISTMDSKSFMDHGPDFANALVPVLQGTHRISSEIQRVANG